MEERSCRIRSVPGLALVLSAIAFVLVAAPVRAQDCSDYGGVLDGFAGDIAPSQLQIDQNCTIRNFPASNPLRTNFSFFTQPGQNDDRWLVVFDNVVHTGQMSCNSVLEHKIWFTNGSSTSIQEGCQNLLIPVEKIEKQNPAGQTTATVGVPFTYRLIMPVLFDAGTGTVINNQGSLNDLHGVTVTDDLNATGVDLTYVSHTAYWLDTGAPVTHTFSNVAGLLTFDNFPVIPSGDQIVVEVTVVLEDTPTNADGTEFFNTAKWDFGRLIDGVYYEPLPGEWGISPPMTIASPELVVSKTGPAFLNLGEQGTFTIDVQNAGGADAWDVTLTDELPNGPMGGLCDVAPSSLTAQVFAADGVTPVPGKGPLTPGTDFSFSFSSAPFCELSLTMLTAAAAIGPDERLIVTYVSELDADTQNGVALTNVAGATEWFNGDSGNADRQAYSRTITDGTVGTADHEDAHTVAATLSGSFFDKTVANLTTGVSPAATATPGDTLRYTLRVRTTDTPLVDAVLYDDLGALNASVVFSPGSLALVPGTLPPGADASNTDANGGTNGAGVIDIRQIDLPVDSEVLIQFDVTLAPVIANGTVVLNQSELTNAGAPAGVSDDPNVNGRASPDVAGDEDPTEIQITSAPAFDIDKISAYLTGDPTLLLAGETLRYTITVGNVGTADVGDAVLTDQVPANTSYVAGSTTLNGIAVPDPAAGVAPLSQGMAINVPGGAPGSMPADASGAASATATVEFDVVVDPGVADGTLLSNQAFVSTAAGGIVDQPSDDPRTPAADDPTEDLVGNLRLINADFEKTVTNLTTGTSPATTATPGDTLRYSLRVRTSNIPLVDAVLYDDLGGLNASPMFVPGSLSLVPGTLPPGVDASNTDPNGGTNGTGVLDIRQINLPTDSELLIEFDVTLAPAIENGTVVLNQSELTNDGVPAGVSDDPYVNGAADPDVVGDEDPTPVQITSAPVLDVDKVSSYVTGDPSVLMAGETLRYTITVRNLGTDHIVDAMLRDDVPANTTYVAGSTTLNGASVPDPAAGLSPLSQGIAINAAGSQSPGLLPADPSGAATATIVFDVVVDPDLIDGTIIENQGFVSAAMDGIADVPSDDPRTQIVDDPTRDIVGNLPLIYAEKSAALEMDAGTPGVVDPGDWLRYRITVYNNGATPATEVVLTDAVPANTTYVADSTTLNGLAVGQPDAGAAPLAAGVPISSSDLTPPLPGAGAGTLTPGQSAVLEYVLRVDDGVPTGTLIVNQATVSSNELPSVLTDGDGNPATGPEPTVVVVGPSQQLTISKTVAVVGGGPALAGSTLEYTVRVNNISPVPASYVVITDDLDLPVPGQLTYVDQSATMNGLADGVTFAGSLLTAEYSDTYGALEPGAEILLRFRAVVDANLPIGTIVTNTADVRWNDPPQTASASVSVTVGGIVGIGVLSGLVWHDANFDDVLDPGERELANWTVTLYRNDVAIHTTTTDGNGSYRIVGVAPNYLTPDIYELRFDAPGAGARTAPLGLADSDFTNYLQRIGDIVVQSGSNLTNLNLPIEPNGVVYHSLARVPIAGAVVSLLDAGGTPLPAACFDDPAQQSQVTLASGYYKFDLNFSEPACPSGGDYLIDVAAPGTGFVSGYSTIIPPASDATTGAFDVPSCPGSATDALPATAQHCEAQPSPLGPNLFVPAQSAGTVYHVLLTLDDSQPPGSAQLFNNHLPLDPDLADAVSITKTTPAVNVRRGDLVPYFITVTSDLGFDLDQTSIVDRLPPGFRYVEGSARMDGVPLEPARAGRDLVWRDMAITSSARHELELLLAVGSGVSEGEFVNRAQVLNELTGMPLSNEATATVRLVPDPDLDCTDVTGKVFDDRNRNGTQDSGEAGIPGVRLVTATGLAATTDSYGRFHITCATVPNATRGSNFVLKLDDRTLPSGFRLSSQPIRIERATRGKALNFSFGASIHRVIGLDISDPVFRPGLTELRPQWEPRIGLLLEELRKAPAILRLSYLADLEDPALVDARLEAIERTITEAWSVMDTGYELTVEPEVFWRLGGPPEAPRGSRSERRSERGRGGDRDSGSGGASGTEGGTDASAGAGVDP